MNYETACKLLIEQTVISEDNSDTLLTRMQQGKPPVPGQITSILLALKVVYEGLKESTTLDRELAYALFKLSIKTQQLFALGRKAGVDWPPLFKEDLLRISQGVDGIFSGEWHSLY